jgi:SAM-dependent methyltransferase
MSDIDWVERWKSVVQDRAGLAGGHSRSDYWDQRAKSYARSTQVRADEFLAVLEPYLAPTKTLIDVGAGTGRHAAPLAGRLEWVTAVEPSDGMRAHIPPLENMTVIASNWEDAEVAPADLVICAHVMYGVADPVPFIAKLNRFALEQVFVMLRESDIPHPAARVRARLMGDDAPRLPRFSDLFMLLVQMGITPDVTFLRYAVKTRYAGMDEAIADSRAMLGEAWDEAAVRSVLEEVLRPDGDELVFDGGETVSGVAHWRPPES